MSESYPDWLPPLEHINSYGGDWHKYVDVLYAIYELDFIRNKFNYNSKRVSTKREPYTNGKDRTFWHIIQKAETNSGNEDDRTPDFRRCERIRWPKPIIQNHQYVIIKKWQRVKRKIKGTKPRTYLWFNDEYLVVLEERNKYVLFITAFPTERGHSIAKLEKEFQDAKKENRKADAAKAASETPSAHGG